MAVRNFYCFQSYGATAGISLIQDIDIMRINKYWIVFLIILTTTCVAQADPLRITLSPEKTNPAIPIMGDKLHLHSVITNVGDKPVKGVVAWISLVETTPGHEQPMDLEDWSAHKAVTADTLAPGASLKTDWSIRLIQHGDYRVVISVTARSRRGVNTSPTVEFHVKKKPAIQSARILPIAIGIPCLLLLWIIFQVSRNRLNSKPKLKRKK